MSCHLGSYPKYKDSGIEWLGEIAEMLTEVME